MFKLDIMVRPNKDGWGAEITSLPGCFSGGENIEVLKLNIREAIDLHLEAMLEDDEKVADELVRGDYELELHIKIQDLSEYFPLTVKGVSERAGINRTLLNQYVRGEKTMSEKQALRITTAIHLINTELAQLQF